MTLHPIRKPARTTLMFGFGKSNKDPLADVSSVERWLASFPENDPLALTARSSPNSDAIAEPAAHRTPGPRGDVLRRRRTAPPLRRPDGAVHRARESQFQDRAPALVLAVRPDPGVPGRLLRIRPRRVQARRRAPGGSRCCPNSLCRQIIHIGLDAKIRIYRYEHWIPAKWAELHGLFALALSGHFERQLVTIDADGEPTTIEHAYVHVLVLQLVHAGNTTVKHLEYLDDELEQWCLPLRLTLEPSSETSFYVDLGGREGLKRRGAAPLEGNVLFLDTRPLHAVLMQNLVVLEQKLRMQPLSERTPKRTEQLALLAKGLALQADPESEVALRPARRTRGRGGCGRCHRRLHQDIRLSERRRAIAAGTQRVRPELRRNDGTGRVRTCATTPTVAWKSRGGDWPRSPPRVARGRSRTCARPVSG